MSLATPASQTHLAQLEDWQQRARRVLPAGGFGNFDPAMVIERGQGSRVWDAAGREYIDYLIGSGPMLLGHGHPEVDEAIREQLGKGLTFFANNTAGIELAEVICDALPCAEQLRYVSTGGEADMYAMRLARAHTGREKILKFEGGYHGMSAEALMSMAPKSLVNYPSAVPDTAGLPASVQDGVLIAPFNDLEATRQIIAEFADQIAGIIVEPLQRLIPPEPGFLAMLRQEADARGIVLIFDEVVTGFRFGYGGAQTLYGVTPDVATLGKTIGGGFPSAAIVGRADVMAHFDKAKVGEAGFLFQMGTLSGNPMASVAGLKTLEILRRPGTYEALKAKGERIMAATRHHLERVGIAHQIVGEPYLFDVVFSNQPVRSYRDGLRGDADLSARWNATLREEGIFKSAGKMYMAVAHSDEDLALTEAAIEAAADSLT
jgi:glutamate-1-semialdehyde 2,1-aminomutase